jgi:glyoxylase I family protein
VASGTIHHVDLTVRALADSTRFYDAVMPLLGFRHTKDAPEGPIYAGASIEVGLVEARSHARLGELGVRVLDPPAEYPQYAPGYYAVFFADPDGLKLEYVFTPSWPT